MDITKKTVTELKALAFDTIVIIEQNQKNLQVINNEIASRVKGEDLDRAVDQAKYGKNEKEA